jgi:hypothetical protein
MDPSSNLGGTTLLQILLNKISNFRIILFLIFGQSFLRSLGGKVRLPQDGRRPKPLITSVKKDGLDYSFTNSKLLKKFLILEFLYITIYNSITLLISKP